MAKSDYIRLPDTPSPQSPSLHASPSSTSSSPFASPKRSPASRFAALAAVAALVVFAVYRSDVSPPSWNPYDSLTYGDGDVAVDSFEVVDASNGSDDERVVVVQVDDLVVADVMAQPIAEPTPPPPTTAHLPLRPLKPKLDYFQGDWEFTMTPISDYKSNRCPVADKKDTSKSTMKKAKQRAKNTLRWDWKPDGPQDWWKWTEEAFLQRILQSSIGLLIIGDSLSGQHYLTAQSHFKTLQTQLPPHTELFVRPSSTNVLNYPTAFPTRFEGAHEPLFLNPAAAHVLFPDLEASRLERPVVTFIRADYLVHKSELIEIMSDEIGGETSIELNRAERDDDVATRTEKLPEQWRHWIEYWLRENPWQTKQRQERSIIVMNTGSHWTEYGRFGFQGQTNAQEFKLLLATYTRVTNYIVEFFETFASDVHLIYRTLSPGHPYCSSSPVQSVPTFLLSISGTAVGRAGKDKTSVWDEYGWERFKDLDEVWRSTLTDTLNGQLQSPSPQSKPLDWKIDLMEIRDQAAGRGDAHNGAYKGDCLHWCLPTIPHQWMLGLGSVVLDKGR